MSLSDAQRTLIHVRSILKLQWRALVGALLMATIYVTDFIYFVVLFPDPVSIKDQWVKDWYTCLEQPGGSQDACANIAEGQFPNYSLTVYVLFINRCAGILIFIIFAAKKSVFVEWYELITGKPINSNVVRSASINGPGSRPSAPNAKPQPARTRPKKVKRKNIGIRSFATISAVTAATIHEDEEPEEYTEIDRPSLEFRPGDNAVQRAVKHKHSLSTLSSHTDPTQEPEGTLQYLTPPPRAVQERRSITDLSVYSVPQTPLNTPPQSRKASLSSSIHAPHSPTTSQIMRLSISSIGKDLPPTSTSYPTQENNGSSLSPQSTPSMPRASFGVPDLPSFTHGVNEKHVEEKRMSLSAYEERRISISSRTSRRSSKANSLREDTPGMTGELNQKRNSSDTVKLRQSIVIDPGITLTFEPVSQDIQEDGDGNNETRTLTFGAAEEHEKWVDNYLMSLDPSVGSNDVMEELTTTNTSRAQSPTSTEGRRLSRKNNSDESLVIPISDLYETAITSVTLVDQKEESTVAKEADVIPILDLYEAAIASITLADQKEANKK